MVTLLNSKQQMKLYPEISDRVLNELTRTINLMGFGKEWRFRVAFKKLNGDTQANCITEWHYHLARLNFDLKKMSTEPPEHQLATVRHELMHVVLSRFCELLQSLAPEHVELVEKYEEELCTFIEHMPVWGV